MELHEISLEPFLKADVMFAMFRDLYKGTRQMSTPVRIHLRLLGEWWLLCTILLTSDSSSPDIPTWASVSISRIVRAGSDMRTAHN